MEAIELEQWYNQYKPLLFSIAYRMLGTVSEAEDIVHDMFLTLPQAELQSVRYEKAFLCKMVTNRCIDYLRSARKQREVYVGPWLPEPLLTASAGDPLAQAEQKDDLSFAMLLLLEQLNPVERAVFILREAFDYDYKEIALFLERSEASCRKIYSRLKPRLQQLPAVRPAADIPEVEPLLSGFLSAVHSGDMDAMLRVLSDDAMLYSDGGGKVLAALRPMISPERVAHFLHGITRKRPVDTRIEPAVFNGMPAVGVITESSLKTLMLFEFVGDRLHRVYLISNPDKLRHVTSLFL